MIEEIYKTVTAIVNKENNGYVSPTEFNLLSNNIQNEIYRGYFEDENLDKIKERRGFTSSGYANLDFNQRQRITPFSTSSVLSGETQPDPANTYTEFILPSNLYYVEDEGIMSLTDSYPPTKSKVVDEVENSEINRLIGSESAPSSVYPVYTRIGSSIRVYPSSITSVDITYLRKPAAPKWTYQVVTGGDGAVSELYDPTNSSFQDFELRESEFSNIVIRMLSFFGINLREADLVKIAEILKDKNNLKDNQ